MGKKYKVLAFTAIRSEYDLLSDLYKLLNNDNNIEFKLIVSGAHLSSTYGFTVQEIEKDGLSILAKIETLIDSNSKVKRPKSASILFQSALDIVSQYQPDLILYAGDREEVIIASLIGGYLEIPTIHFYGGDHVKDSHIDNPVRHATSKLSTFHFVSTEEHKKRLICMGEKEERIFNIGSIALDKFVSFVPIKKDKLKEVFNVGHFDKFALVIFHPIPKEREKSAKVFENILLSLKENNINAFVSYPNIDPGSDKIIEIINKYENDKNFKFYKNLPRELFLSIYKNAEFIIGNSSSGILESASVPIPAINVGYRQTGRTANENVVYVNTDLSSINNAIKNVISKEFKNKIRYIKNIYGDGNSAQKAFNIIKNLLDKKDYLQNMIFKDEDPLELCYEK